MSTHHESTTTTTMSAHNSQYLHSKFATHVNLLVTPGSTPISATTLYYPVLNVPANQYDKSRTVVVLDEVRYHYVAAGAHSLSNHWTLGITGLKASDGTINEPLLSNYVLYTGTNAFNGGSVKAPNPAFFRLSLKNVEVPVVRLTLTKVGSAPNINYGGISLYCHLEEV